ncbi:MAG: peroxiredoxin [Cyanobium sp. CZS 25K]|nr:peroxiredoxin [Cyanobium sp. CZS25K]
MPDRSLVVNRRAFLGGAALAATGLLLRPARAEAMGGSLPEIGKPAPGFDLDGVAPAADGEVGPTHLTKGDFQGRWLALYFYPKDFTSGCTLEARGFQRDLAAFHTRQAQVVGVSADDPEAHLSFCGSEGLAYPLLSDPGGAVSRSYGSWLAPFSARHTFLIDPDGVLRASWLAVRPSGHSQEVLAELTRLQGEASL